MQREGEYKKEIDKRDEIIEIYNRWLYLQEKGVTIQDYLKKKGFFKIAIYGAGTLGKHLLVTLMHNGIEVRYLIDKNADNIFSSVEVYSPDSDLESVDAIIITTVGIVANEIKEVLTNKMKVPVIIFKDILYRV